MTYRVVVWGTGNVGQPALRSVLSHADMDLVGVVVSNPDKVGIDAGELAGLAPVGVAATDDTTVATSGGVDAVVYAASGDFRPDDAVSDIAACLASGANVVSTSVYGLLHPPTTPEPLASRIGDACAAGNSSVFVSGIDPGWVMDALALFATGMGADITEVRCQEIFNYALYDAPDAVRTLCGFGTSMDDVPPMLWDFSLQMVWAPMIRVLADGLGVELDEVRTQVERRPLDRTVEVEGMGTFEQGTQGAFRFEVQGIVDGRPLLVMEHITRIDDSCASEWPSSPTAGGCHRVLLSGSPDLEITVHGHDAHTPTAAGGGNASAANRIVNAIPAVKAAPPGIVHPLDLPGIWGGPQLRR